MHIDCADCAMQHTDACSDCIVTYLLDRPEGAIVFDVAEERAIRALQTGGHIADTRFVAAPPSAHANARVGT